MLQGASDKYTHHSVISRYILAADCHLAGTRAKLSHGTCNKSDVTMKLLKNEIDKFIFTC